MLASILLSTARAMKISNCSDHPARKEGETVLLAFELGRECGPQGMLNLDAGESWGEQLVGLWSFS